MKPNHHTEHAMSSDCVMSTEAAWTDFLTWRPGLRDKCPFTDAGLLCTSLHNYYPQAPFPHWRALFRSLSSSWHAFPLGSGRPRQQFWVTSPVCTGAGQFLQLSSAGFLLYEVGAMHLTWSDWGWEKTYATTSLRFTGRDAHEQQKTCRWGTWKNMYDLRRSVVIRLAYLLLRNFLFSHLSPNVLVFSSDGWIINNYRNLSGIQNEVFIFHS